MPQIHQDVVEKILKPLLWDYQIDAISFYLVALGQEKIPGLSQQRALLRMLERLNWYDILDLFELEFIQEQLTTELVARLRFPEMRKKYELIRKILHREPVSFPGWGAETRQRAQDSILSNRWYRPQSVLF